MGKRRKKCTWHGLSVGTLHFQYIVYKDLEMISQYFEKMLK